MVVVDMGDHESIGECPPVNDQTAKDDNNMSRKVCDALVRFNAEFISHLSLVSPGQ